MNDGGWPCCAALFMNDQGRRLTGARLGGGLARNAVNPSMGALREHPCSRQSWQALPPIKPPPGRVCAFMNNASTVVEEKFLELDSRQRTVASLMPRRRSSSTV